jgi:enamine deaminase RidA (YjgF/YER057c/UK114 family)
MFAFRSSVTSSRLSPTLIRRFLHVEKRLQEHNIELPSAPKPAANYNLTCHAANNMLYLSGHLPILSDGGLLTGPLGPGDVEAGYKAARQAGLNILATLQRELGDLDRVERVVKIFGIVHSKNDFQEQHKVMNGCSDLMMLAFGETVGYHARSAIGTNTLPMGVSVEVEAVVQIKA